MTTEKKATYAFQEILNQKGLFVSTAVNAETAEKFIVLNKEKRVPVEGAYGEYMIKRQSIWVPFADFKEIVSLLNAKK